MAEVGLTVVGGTRYNTSMTNNNNTSKENTMTKTEAINYVRSEMQTVLDDDYPDKMESLVDELIDMGYGEDAAEELIFDTQEWV